MAQFKADDLAREMKRWARLDAHHFVRPDWRRHVKPGSEAAAVFEIYERKYRADQARVPRRSRDGGQWTDEGRGGRSEERSPVQTAGRISPARAEECEFMHRQDLFICRATQSAACYEQANLRYSNCTNGRQIPPLNF
jgi:hypothetical protein